MLLAGCASRVPQVSISRTPGPERQNGASATASAAVQIQAEKDQEEYSLAVQNQVNKSWKTFFSPGNPRPEKGLVMIEFSVHRDGTVSDFRQLTSAEGGSPKELCEKVIRGAAPFPKWTARMLEAFPYDYVKYRYTFYFDQP